MALRVLLADESSTIKKVMQLALQDFGVEVKSVQLGVDVIEVAKSFKPDIVFADVLLQKLNGYEVSYEIKKDDQLKNIPVVLMWSSFMDLDEQKFAASGAEDRLEKPFDVEDLRAIVLSLIPKAKDQKLAPYLIFSPSISSDFIEDEKQKAANPPSHDNEQSVVLTTDGVEPDPTANSQNNDNVTPLETKSNTGQSLIDSNDFEVSNELSGLSSITTEEEHQITSQGDQDWNMDDFQDVSDFADDEDSQTSDMGGGEYAVDNDNVAGFKAPGDEQDSSEEFENLNLSHMDETGLTRTSMGDGQHVLPDPPENIDETYDQPDSNFNQSLEEKTTAGSQEGWESQDLDEFQIDFDDEDEDESFHVTNVTNISNQSVDDGFLLKDEPTAENSNNQKPQNTPPRTNQTQDQNQDISADDFLSGTDQNDDLDAIPRTHIVDLNELDDEGFDSIENFDFEQIKTPTKQDDSLKLDQAEEDQNSTLSLERDPRQSNETVQDLSTKIAMDPAMRAVLEAQIEKVLRDQSTLIAEIVRRVLPEIATEVIKKELKQLLEEDED